MASRFPSSKIKAQVVTWVTPDPNQWALGDYGCRVQALLLVKTEDKEGPVMAVGAAEPSTLLRSPSRVLQGLLQSRHLTGS